MKRTLRRGSTFKTPDGVSHTRMAHEMKLGKEKHPAGTVFSTVGGRMRAGGSPEFEVSPETYAHDPSLWEMTPEETAKVKAEKAAAEVAWYKVRGQSIPDKEREILEKEGTLAPENKEFPGTEEAKRGLGRPRMTVKG